MKRKDASPNRRRKVSVIASTLKPIRIIILGSIGVGKSALTVRLLTRRFIGEYDSSLGKLTILTVLISWRTRITERVCCMRAGIDQNTRKSLCEHAAGLNASRVSSFVINCQVRALNLHTVQRELRFYF